MSVHTPGPWITETNAHGEPRVYTPGVDSAGDADWTGWIDLAGEAATEANARLIAAAPELLSELMDAVRVMEQMERAIADPEPVGDFDPLRAARQKMALAVNRFNDVIAKASGGAA